MARRSEAAPAPGWPGLTDDVAAGSSIASVSAVTYRGGISAIPNSGERGGCQSLDMRESDYRRDSPRRTSTGPWSSQWPSCG
jgi:hypothetical protein